MWDDIGEITVEQSEIEDRFENKKKEITLAASPNRNVKVASKKTYFDAALAQNMLIVINKLPPPNALKEALRLLDEKAVT